MMMSSLDLHEYLETDGLGGFASGTVSGIRTRRTHALLLAANKPPAGRMVLVNGVDARVRTNNGNFSISAQHYAPDVLEPDGFKHLKSFKSEPWPQWTFELEDGTTLIQELFVVHGSPLAVMAWKLVGRQPRVKLEVRPYISGRSFHALHHENPAARLDALVAHEQVSWVPYEGVPAVTAASNGAYVHQPDWYRNFIYSEERSRGLDDTEDLIAPGVFRWELSTTEAVLCFTTDSALLSAPTPVLKQAQQWRNAERKRRASFASPLHRAADAYLVKRGKASMITAGYPWFADWGRDAFISLRGLCLATGRLDHARQILLEWAGAVSEGMLPDRFPDSGEQPEYSSVDASLWYIIAVDAFLKTMEAESKHITKKDRQIFRGAIDAILAGYARGARFGIRMDSDGLLAAGAPGVPLTWMDAKAGDWVATPRVGKPVEVQALWINALWIGSAFSEHWDELFAKARESFRTRFWNQETGCLYDVIDVDHVPGRVDASLRPNQVFAVGGLPLKLINGERGKHIVEIVEKQLLTPIGLRSLGPQEPGYVPRCEGGAREWDGAYHQGAVWPWLMGPFVEAWVRIHGSNAEHLSEARKRFIEPLKLHLQTAGIGHLPEIADAEPPHAPRGCLFQAWSLAELLRLEHLVSTLKTTAQTPAASADRPKPVLAGAAG